MHPYYRAILDAYASARRPLFHQLSPDAAKTMMRATIAAIPPPTGLPDLALVVDAAIAGRTGKSRSVVMSRTVKSWEHVSIFTPGAG